MHSCSIISYAITQCSLTSEITNHHHLTPLTISSEIINHYHR
jgi:hypothetical protein